MALTGVALITFVFAHMMGNLHQYAYFLHQVIPAPIRWAFRLGLLLMVGVHLI